MKKDLRERERVVRTGNLLCCNRLETCLVFLSYRTKKLVLVSLKMKSLKLKV